MDEKKLHTWKFQPKGSGGNMRCKRKRLTGKTTVFQTPRQAGSLTPRRAGSGGCMLWFLAFIFKQLQLKNNISYLPQDLLFRIVW